VIYDARQKDPQSAPDRTLWAPYPVREYASRVGRDPFQPLLQFSEIGYPLYRDLTLVTGRPPRYKEFMEDLKTLGRGLYPEMPGWRDVLKTNRQRLTDSWINQAPSTERKTRAEMLTRIGAGSPPSTHDYNAAYVLLHYFGYLKRDIDQDSEGYDFWLRNLDRTSDYRGLTRAFIESQEYKEQTP
jgi:hypothetical protein